MTDKITLPRSVVQDVIDSIERYQVKRQDFDTFDGVLKPLLDSLIPSIFVQPEFTTGHCLEKKKPGGCKLHNIFCGFPVCDRKKVEI